MDWKQTTEQLIKPLDPKNVIKPSGEYGPKGDYIEGWHAIDEANRIFGFDGWSYVVNELKLVSQSEPNTKGVVSIGYTCLVTVHVDDVKRQDVGYGSGHSKNIGDAHEGAVKEAVTDALKRSLRTFGNQFGLALYDKTQKNVREEEPAQKTEKQIHAENLYREMKAITTKQGLQSFWEEYGADIETFEPAVLTHFTNLNNEKQTALEAA